MLTPAALVRDFLARLRIHRERAETLEAQLLREQDHSGAPSACDAHSAEGINEDAPRGASDDEEASSPAYDAENGDANSASVDDGSFASAPMLSADSTQPHNDDYKLSRFWQPEGAAGVQHSPKQRERTLAHENAALSDRDAAFSRAQSTKAEKHNQYLMTKGSPTHKTTKTVEEQQFAKTETLQRAQSARAGDLQKPLAKAKIFPKAKKTPRENKMPSMSKNTLRPPACVDNSDDCKKAKSKAKPFYNRLASVPTLDVTRLHRWGTMPASADAALNAMRLSRRGTTTCAKTREKAAVSEEKGHDHVPSTHAEYLPTGSTAGKQQDNSSYLVALSDAATPVHGSARSVQSVQSVQSSQSVLSTHSVQPVHTTRSIQSVQSSHSAQSSQAVSARTHNDAPWRRSPLSENNARVPSGPHEARMQRYDDIETFMQSEIDAVHRLRAAWSSDKDAILSPELLLLELPGRIADATRRLRQRQSTHSTRARDMREKITEMNALHAQLQEERSRAQSMIAQWNEQKASHVTVDAGSPARSGAQSQSSSRSHALQKQTLEQDLRRQLSEHANRRKEMAAAMRALADERRAAEEEFHAQLAASREQVIALQAKVDALRDEQGDVVTELLNSTDASAHVC